VLTGTIGGFAINAAAQPRFGAKPLMLWAVTTALITALGTLFVWAYSAYLFDSRPRSLVVLIAEVGLVSGAAGAIIILVNRPGAQTRAAPAGASQDVRFFARLPSKLKGAQIYAVEAEDHYLRVHTSKGSDLVLMRLSDAIRELDGVEGAQTHRSWWVARDGVAEVRRTDRRVVLALKDGSEAPVSRPNIRPLRDLGWF
jgi:DNA-binding LytR/AlgR family response regulator